MQTVSYTHLDVYKRQTFNWAKARRTSTSFTNKSCLLHYSLSCTRLAVLCFCAISVSLESKLCQGMKPKVQGGFHIEEELVVVLLVGEGSSLTHSV